MDFLKQVSIEIYPEGGAETTFPSITKAGRLNILYSMIFNKSSSFTKVASLPNSYSLEKYRLRHFTVRS